MNKTVFRVHRRDKVDYGMYLGNGADYCNEMHGPRHPMPYDDGKLMHGLRETTGSDHISGGFLFGFVSLEQLLFWIYKAEWRAALAADGFVVSEISAETVIRGDTQAIFDEASAFVVKHIEWDDIHV